ncbi:MAG TPA: hypothetical protein VHG30_09645 [Microvirga sp.]|nr:hypothetical protein [Microvirga sp.]
MIFTRLSDDRGPEATLSHFERCLLRLGRVHVDAARTSKGRDAVASLARRGLMSISHDGPGGAMIAETTHAGRCALAWIEAHSDTAPS